MSFRDHAVAAVGLVDKWVDIVAWSQRVPAVAVGIAVDGETILAKGYGFADTDRREPATADTLFRIASHSKVFTATAIAVLWQAGRLRLDDRVADHLAWFASDGDPNLSQVTLRDLLTHSAGMNRDGYTGHWMNDEFPEAAAIREQSADGLSVFGVGEHWKYSNMGFTILGQVIEAVTGSAYEEAVAQLVLEPMGLNATTPDFDDASLREHATGYGIAYPGREREVFDHVHARAMNAATGFSSNVRDLLSFYAHHLPDNDAVLEPRAKREMQRTQFEEGETRWGLGFGVAKSAGERTVGHGGAYPGFKTGSFMNPERGLVVVVLTNAMDGEPQHFLDGIAHLLHYADRNADALAPDDGDEPGFYDEVTDWYGSRWGVSVVGRMGGKLVSVPADVPLTGAAIARFEHLGDHRFQCAEAPHNGAFGEASEIVRVDDEYRIRAGLADQVPFRFER